MFNLFSHDSLARTRRVPSTGNHSHIHRPNPRFTQVNPTYVHLPNADLSILSGYDRSRYEPEAGRYLPLDPSSTNSEDETSADEADVQTLSFPMISHRLK